MTNKAQTRNPSLHGEDRDRLSSLPDNIIINSILSLLPMREAQQTSFLSRTWRYLWLYVPWLGLDLDGYRKHPNNQIISNISLRELDEAAYKYAEWVDQTIDAYRGTTATAALRHFRVVFGLDNRYASKINSWLEFSLRQGVEVLELDCCYTLLQRPRYRFLSVEPSRFPNIRLLRSLSLKAVHMPNDSLNDLLLACEFLERLDLAHVSALSQVNVIGPVSRLKHIHIDDCYGVKSILIHAPTPDLVSFTYPEHNLEITLQHAPRLVDLRLRVFYKYSTVHPLFLYLSQLEALHLVYFPCDMSIDPLHDFPVLIRLKHLKLDLDGSWGYRGSKYLRKKLHCLASLTEIAPLLQHLTLEVGELRSYVLKEELANMRQLSVRAIEIAGFSVSRDVHCELALHLIRASPSLEKLIIDHRNIVIRGRMLGPYIYYEKSRKIWEKRVKEVIEPELPSKAKLVLI